MAIVREPRLRFHLDTQGAIWYHVQASRSHVLIDPQAEARTLTSGFVRPIELWCAPRWQLPPRVAVVRYNEMDGGSSSVGTSGAETSNTPDSDVPPAIGDVINLSSVVDFLSDVSASRLGALGTLVDAVAAAIDGGPPVVLAASSAGEGALWIGAVSFLAAPAAALRMSFSTQERLVDVLAQVDKDLAAAEPDGWRTPVISVVPEADVDRLTRRDELPVVVVDPRVAVIPDDVVGVEHRRTHVGQLIEVSDWSRLALSLCCEDFVVVERCLRELDKVGPEPEGAGLEWPLAAAIARTGDLSLAMATASRVVPSARVEHTRRAWVRLQTALRSSARNTLIEADFEHYLQLALNDDDWLLRQPPPLPEQVPSDPELAFRLQAPLVAMVHRLTRGLGTEESQTEAGEDVRRGLLLLRGVDFAHRIAQLVGGPDLAAVGISRLAARAGEVLADPVAGPRVAQVVGPVDGAALARWVVPPLSHPSEPWLTSAAAVGERLAAPVIALLARAVDPALLNTAAPIETGAGRTVAAQPVALEVAVASAVGRIAGDPQLRAPAVEYLLDEAARAYPDADPAPMVAGVFARLRDDEPWTAPAWLRLVERAPAMLGAELVPVVLAELAHWGDDPASGRLAAALLKRIEFLTRRGGDGRIRPRRAGITDEQVQLLNLLVAGADGWLQVDDGLHRRAAEILMWSGRAWAGADQEVRRLIAPRTTVAAFQVALAAEPAQAGTVLRSRLDVVPVGTEWRAAVAIGLEPALPMLAEILRLNRYRLSGELVLASTRAMLDPPQHQGDAPRLSMLPVGPVLRWLVLHEARPELTEHLGALVDQELDRWTGPVDRPRLLAFWAQALPGTPVAEADRGPFQLPETVLTEVLQVALGMDTTARDRNRPPWWRRWVAR
jgi:GTPase-associated protein 1